MIVLQVFRGLRMPHRAHLFSLRISHALREGFLQEPYSIRRLWKDVMAGFTVGIIAIPLAMALAIASGVAPQYGLYTAIIGGFLIPLRDMYWPFELFYYVMPYSYYVRSSMYEIFSHSTFEACTESVSAVCVNSTAGLDVLQELKQVFPVLSTEDNTIRDGGVMIGIGVFYKILYVVGVLYKTSLVTTVKPAEETIRPTQACKVEKETEDDHMLAYQCYYQ